MASEQVLVLALFFQPLKLSSLPFQLRLILLHLLLLLLLYLLLALKLIPDESAGTKTKSATDGSPCTRMAYGTTNNGTCSGPSQGAYPRPLFPCG